MEPARPVLEAEFLGSMQIEIKHSVALGETPSGWRRFDVLSGGRFEGPRLKGTILDGGNDIVLRRANGVLYPDVRLVMQTDDGAAVLITYRGIRHASPSVSDRLTAGEHVPRGEYYLRNAPFFETGAEQYAWLNHVLCVGVGRRESSWVIYDVFEIR